MLPLALGALALLFVAWFCRDLLSALRTPLLEPVPDDGISLAQVTAIIPARNEARRIGRCLAGLAAQNRPAAPTALPNRPELAVIVLDDSSTDGTAEVAHSFAEQLPGLRVVEGAPLPHGWAGKCWACWQAAEAAETEWLLFFDADVEPQPGIVNALLRCAQQRRVDMLSLIGLQELGSFWERALLPAFTGIIQATFPLDAVNDPRSPLALANGQCILIRRDVYFAVDGHRGIRDSVLEDVRLAQQIKRAGYRLLVAGGPRLMRVRMYTSFAEVAEGLRKNAIAGVRASDVWRAAVGGLRQAIMAFVPAGLVVSGAALLALGRPEGSALLIGGAALLLATLVFWGYVMHRLSAVNPVWAVLYPLGTAVYFALAARALLDIVAGRGVTWKGRTYRG